jgi:hypothetical protein
VLGAALNAKHNGPRSKRPGKAKTRHCGSRVSRLASRDELENRRWPALRVAETGHRVDVLDVHRRLDAEITFDKQTVARWVKPRALSQRSTSSPNASLKACAM